MQNGGSECSGDSTAKEKCHSDHCPGLLYKRNGKCIFWGLSLKYIKVFGGVVIGFSFLF